MRAALAAGLLMLLGGCGSCVEDKVEDKQVPRVDEAPPKVRTIVTRTTDGGLRRPLVVEDHQVDFSAVFDAGR